jgi:hypothetical protein
VLNRIQPGFAGSDANGLLYLGDKNLSIANAAGLRRAPDGIDRLVHHIVAEHDLDLHLRQKIDDVFGAGIEFRMALLAPEPFGFCDRDALESDLLQSLLYFIEFEGLDDCLDFFSCNQLFGVADHRQPHQRKRSLRAAIAVRPTSLHGFAMQR